MHEQTLARLGAEALGTGIADDVHPGDGVPGEPEAASGAQSGRPDDLHLDELVVPPADAVDGLGAQPDLGPELSDGEFSLLGDRDAPAARGPAARAASVSTPDPVSGGAVAGEAAPWGVALHCELADGLPALPGPGGGGVALVLVRLFGEPIGLLTLGAPRRGLTPAELGRAITEALTSELRPRFEDCGLEWTGELPVDGLQPPRTPRFVAGRERVLAEGPEITVAVCTRDRTDGVERVIASLREQHYPRLRILIVDNAPSDDGTERVVRRLQHEIDIDYVREDRPGLSWARNRAIEDSRSEIIAWADDDEVCDPWWATEIARGFVEVPEAGAVTGMVAPAELHTRNQMWFEQYSGVGRGRGFRRAVFSPATAAQQSPLYPLPPWGAGANMAFRRSAIEAIGRFDPALGTGTRTLAGEDTAALSALLYTGGTVVYQPSAIVFHRHRRDYAALERVMLGYGRGLSAYYASMVARHPRCLPELVRLSRRAVRDQLSSRGGRLTTLAGFPPELLRLNRRGLLQGAFLYPGAALRARRLAGAPAGGSPR
jgi:glycosyltransferase involved in cell wall biosynthesis